MPNQIKNLLSNRPSHLMNRHNCLPIHLMPFHRIGPSHLKKRPSCLPIHLIPIQIQIPSFLNPRPIALQTRPRNGSSFGEILEMPRPTQRPNFASNLPTNSSPFHIPRPTGLRKYLYVALAAIVIA